MADGPDKIGDSPDIEMHQRDETAQKPSQAEKQSLGELFAKLICDFRAFAYAEIELLRISYTGALRALWLSALALLLGGILCLSAFVSLFVGVTIVLAPMIGTLPAALAVSIIAAGTGGVIVLAAGRHFGARVSALIPREKPPKDQADDIQGPADNAHGL